MNQHILVERGGPVLTLTLSRPEKRNAITRSMYEVLADAIDGAPHDPDVRCILIQANGEMFTAGNDLADFAAAGEKAEIADKEGPPRGPLALITALARAQTPLVAAVQGSAVGIGVTMLLHCDLVFVAEEAVLTTPFANLGLVPEAASSLLLPLRIGHARAFSMFVLGQKVTGTQAAAWGLANLALPRDEVKGRALAAAQEIASKPPAAVAITKRLMREADRYLERLREEDRHFNAQLKSAETAAALAAFAAKRAPDFSKLGRGESA